MTTCLVSCFLTEAKIGALQGTEFQIQQVFP